MESVYFLSLGCDKNLSDSEAMLGLLEKAGHRFTDDPAQAGVIIVNTCSFIGDAKEESINAILDLARWKKEGRCRALLAGGCLAQRYKDEILKELPELDAVLGTASYQHIAEAVAEALHEEGSPAAYFENVDVLPMVKDRILTGGGYTAYLKIAEGCDKYCTYCAIPFARGRYRSYPMEFLLEQARDLAEKGVKELILVAQETTLYGTDLYGGKKLPELIRRLEEVEGIRWIRLLYGYPEELTDELIECMASSEKLCHYLDLPIQHAADSVLARMGRKTTQAELRERIRQLRERIPDIVLRTTLLTGFPGETEEEHAENLCFLKEIRFDRLGVFCYSREEGTAAARMKGQIPKRIKEKRRRELMLAQQQIAFEKSREMIGRRLNVMIEGKVADENVYVARTAGDAPDVDGFLFFEDEREWESGSFAEVRVTGARGYDLLGERIRESAE
ncbi:MAG: 30S ribosomal protein S12 methylthiotransferase RimO [Lachnospiraceae bacterium]|nr:30S ribosomal protein S12 methylthiotransferase RimO [Lachnospiraceae bacterium]